MSKKQAKIIPEKIHLLSVNIFKANLETSEDFLESPKKIHSVTFGIASDIAHNIEKGRSRFRLYFTMDAVGEEEELLGVQVDYGLEFHFYVENFKDFTQKAEGDEVAINAMLGATLLGMAYSTARGIIFERTRGTFFDGVILPVIDPYKELLRNNNQERSGVKSIK